MARYRPAVLTTSLLFWTCVASALAQPGGPPQQPGPGTSRPDASLGQRAERTGRVRVLVELRLPGGPAIAEGDSDVLTVLAQRQGIANAGGRILGRLTGLGHRLVHRYQTVPFVALEVSPAALNALLSTDPDVVSVREDTLVRPVLAESAPLVEADQVWDAGYDGTGRMIAVLDSGVDASHPMLVGKVVEESCYSSTVAGTSRSVCPNGLDEQHGAGAAAPCSMGDCFHGTHVAGIAAGHDPAAGLSGVARGARIMAVQVFSEVIDAAECGGIAPCMGGFSSDVIAGLERVYARAAQLQIAAVNMSLGSGAYTATCDTEPYKPIIDNLRSIGVPTVVATGNSGYRSSISSPACISSAVSVGSTEKDDSISWFSNISSFTSLLAPGGGIVSSVPGQSYEAFSGTSMAAPHVAGAWALIRQAEDGANVTTVLNVLRQTGIPIRDARFLGTVTVPRMRIMRALASIVPVVNPVPVAMSTSPSSLRAGFSSVLTVIGSGFNTFSVVHWNGAPRPTRVVGTTRLEVSLTAADVPAPGTGQVRVLTPAPGGGSSAALTVVIDPPPALAVSSSTVAPGSPVTATLTNGFGGADDWIALASTSAASSTYLQWTYVGDGVANRTWTIAMPSTAGTYEFRLFRDNGYVRAATSPPVIVDPNVAGLPAITSLSPSQVGAGALGFVLSVTGANFTSGSVVRWSNTNRPTTFVSATQLQAAISAADVATAGSVQVTVVTPPPGGGTSAPLTFTITAPPAVALSASTVNTGASITATVTNPPGNAADWLALVPTSAPNSSYSQYAYLGAGTSTKTVTFVAPSTPGTYEFRLFVNNTFTRAATSPPFTVVMGPNPVPAATSTSPTSMLVGGGAFTLTVRGTGFVAASVVRWNGSPRATTYVGATELRAAITAADVAATGTSQVSVFSPAPGGGLSSTVPFTIAVSTATLNVSTTSAAAGERINLTLANGFGGASDWIIVVDASAPSTSYLTYFYVGAGVTNQTWQVAMPTTPGTYEFRLLLNNGYTRAATSPRITVAAGVQPTLSVSTTTAAPGSQVTVTLTDGFGGNADWIAFAVSTSPSTSYLQYVYVGAGITTRSWTLTVPTTPGTYEFRLFFNNGYTRLATSPPITVGSQ